MSKSACALYDIGTSYPRIATNFQSLYIAEIFALLLWNPSYWLLLPSLRFLQIFIIFRGVVVEICDSSFLGIWEDKRSLYYMYTVRFWRGFEIKKFLCALARCCENENKSSSAYELDELLQKAYCGQRFLQRIHQTPQSPLHFESAHLTKDLAGIKLHKYTLWQDFFF